MIEPTPIRRDFEYCMRCNSQEHITVKCPVARQPMQGGTGGCIRCGSMDLTEIAEDDFDLLDEYGEFYRCPECGLVANATT